MEIGRLLKSKWAILLGIALILLVYYIFDPMESSFMPQCIFHKVTGLKCMGCGSQRMIHSLLHGDISGAFKANAFALCSLPFLGLLLFVEIHRLKFPRLYARVHSMPVIISCATLLIGWFILRNLI